MTSTARPSLAATARSATRAEQRRAAAAEVTRGAERRRQRARWGGALTVLAVVGGVAVLAAGGDDEPVQGATAAAPTVGGDLHTVTALGDALYVGGHAAAAVSRDGGGAWQDVPSLAGADAMGWAVNSDAVLVGGHPGLYRSTDGGATFTPVSGAAAVPDVHSLGGAGTTLYLGSSQAGLLASTDGGRSWQVRNLQAGQSFMGTILVDPSDANRLIVADMNGGVTTSTDGGRTFTPLGGPMGTMAVAWNPTDIDEIVAVGMDRGVRSTDGGSTWQDIDLPQGTSAITYADGGRTLYSGALEGQQALTYRSTDDGVTWTATT